MTTRPYADSVSKAGDLVNRKPRQRRLNERMYRVAGYEFASDAHISTWRYMRLDDARWRAAHLHELVEFSYADIEWKPQPS